MLLVCIHNNTKQKEGKMLRGIEDDTKMNMNEWLRCMKEDAGLDFEQSMYIFRSLSLRERFAIYSRRWFRTGMVYKVKRELLPSRFTEINAHRASYMKCKKFME